MLVRDIDIVEKLFCKLRMIAPSVATKGDYMLTQFWRGKRLQWEVKSVADCLRPTQTRHWDEYCSFSMRNDPTWLLIFSTLSSNIGLFFPHTPQRKVWNVWCVALFFTIIDWLIGFPFFQYISLNATVAFSAMALLQTVPHCRLLFFSLQFEIVSQHLVFANCIPLILKFFNQNIMSYISAKNR